MVWALALKQTPVAVAAHEAVGDGTTVKVSIDVAVPPAVVTETVPVVPVPITATSTVPELEVIEVTAVPPIVTVAAVAPVKLVPLMVIDVPTQPLADPKEVIDGMVGARILTI